MPFDHHIIISEVDAFFYAMVVLALAIGLGIGWAIGYRDGRDTLHDGWIIRNKHGLNKGL